MSIQRFSFSGILVFAHLLALSQASPYYFDISAKASATFIAPERYNGIEDYLDIEEDMGFKDDYGGLSRALLFHYELQGGYEIKDWLSVQLLASYAPNFLTSSSQSGEGVNDINYQGDLDSWQSTAVVDYTAWELTPSVRLDLLYKEEFESFSLIAGFGYGVLRQQGSFGVTGSYRTGITVDRYLEQTRVIDFVRLNLGLEWRDYFAPRFGYFLRLNAFPSLAAATRKIELHKLSIPDYAIDLQNEEIEPGEGSWPEEKHDLFLVELALGISYRF